LRNRRTFVFAAAAAAVAAVSLICVRDHSREDSFSADEPVHILAGYLQVYARTAIVNIEHPPLMKELAGLALLTLPLPAPPAQIPMGNQFTDYGHGLLFAGAVSPDKIAATARFPFLLVLAALLLLLFVLAHRRYGAGSALFAVALVAFDPNFVAHAGVVHTDLGAAVTFLAVIAAAESARRGGGMSVILAGVALGVALATKFSAVYLAPIILLQALLAARGPGAGTNALRATGRLLLIGLVASVVLFGVYAVVCARIDTAAQRQVIHEMVAGRGAPGLSRVIEQIAAFSPPIGHYLGGLASVVRQNAEGGGVNYLFGRVSDQGFASYFYVAFAAKSTLAFLAVTLILLIALLREPEARADGRVWLLPVIVLFLASMGASYNIGIRHLLPVYPLLALAAAGVLSRAWGRGRRVPALLMAGLPLLSAAELARVHPHELSYFNPLAGGPLAGRRILSDSNVDWGLDLRRLAGELERRGVKDPTIVYFGGDDVLYRTGVPNFPTEPEVRGRVVAVSAFLQAVGPMFYAYHGDGAIAVALKRLQQDLAARGRRIGRVGYSIDLYELPPKGTDSR
jgi:hypothetical protein